MKVNGESIRGGFTRQVELPRGDGSSLVLTLQPLSLGFHRRLREREVVPPAAPTRVVRDSNGKPMRDSQGLAVLAADERDAQYLADLELYHQRVAVLVVAESLQADTNIEFETPVPNGSGDWRGYADALHRELEEAGWSAGDLVRLCDEVCRLSNLIDEHLEQSQGNFSRPLQGVLS